MSDVKVTTNNHRRPILDGYELTPAERQEFDYIDWPAIEAGTDSASFFRFRGEVWDLGEFTRLEDNGIVGSLASAGWHGAQTQSYWDAIVVRYEDNYESVVVGHATW